MLPARRIEATTPRRARDQAQLQQIRLNHILDCVARFRQASGKRLNANRATAIDICDHVQITPVHRIKAKRVHFKPVERAIRDLVYLANGLIGELHRLTN